MLYSNMQLANCPIVLSIPAPASMMPVGGVNYFNSSLVLWEHDGTNWNMKTCKPQDVYKLDFSGWNLTGVIDLTAFYSLTSMDFSNNDLSGLNFNTCAIVCLSSWSLNLSDNVNLGYTYIAELISTICNCYAENSGGHGSVNLLNTFLSGSISSLDTQSLFFQVNECKAQNNIEIEAPLVGDLLCTCSNVRSSGGCLVKKDEPILSCGEPITINC